MYNPPVTSKVAPVMYFDISDARNSVASAISSTSPIRPIGIPWQMFSNTLTNDLESESVQNPNFEHNEMENLQTPQLLKILVVTSPR